MPLLVFALATMSCVAADRGAGIQDIAMRWMTIERSLVQMCLAQASVGSVPTGNGPCPIIRTLDEFHKLARCFLDSRMYRTYRIVSPPPSFDVPVAGGPPEIHALADLVLSLRQAVLDGDWDRAAIASSDISGSIAYTMMWGRAANQVIVNMYSQLLLIFGVVTVLAVFTMCVFYGIMTRSQRREEESSSFSRVVLMAQEEERARISRELHDTVVQDVRRLSVEIDKIVKVDERTRREELYAEASVLQTAIAGSLRDICNNLVPLDFGLQGLPDALRRLCFDFDKRTGIVCRMEMAEGTNPGFLDRESQLQVFRIVQEALTNVEKHAKATEAVVALHSETDGNLVIGITDDGVGLKPRAQKDTVGSLPGGMRMGLRGMNERATLLNGNLIVSGEQKKGTQIRLCVPLPPVGTQHTAQPITTHKNASNIAATKTLLIDDHLLINSAITSLLEGTGRFRIMRQVHSLEEARSFVEKAAKQAIQEMPELVVLDIQLGKESGLDFLPFLKDFCQAKQVPMPPVLVCSVFDDPFRIQTALKLGALGYVSKNGNEDELLNAVDTVLRGEVYVPGEHIARLNGISGKYMQLTRRELELINLVKQNKTNDQIADVMCLSKRSVETYISRIYLKTGTENRLELLNL